MAKISDNIPTIYSNAQEYKLYRKGNIGTPGNPYT